MKFVPGVRYLQQATTGDIYIYTDILAARPDMEPFDPGPVELRVFTAADGEEMSGWNKNRLIGELKLRGVEATVAWPHPELIEALIMFGRAQQDEPAGDKMEMASRPRGLLFAEARDLGLKTTASMTNKELAELIEAALAA